MQPEISRFLKKVRRTLESLEMVVAGDHVLVALSGGADSVATAASLQLLGSQLRVSVSAAHVDHRLRGAEAKRDAESARSVASRLGLPFELVRLSGSLLIGGNTEERARELRYAALARVASRIKATKIATGHTRDDQAETVLLRVVRGCGPQGLSGILPSLLVRGQRVIRPLLDCSRDEVEAFLEALDLPHCEDSSNQDRRFTRNRIRHEVLPVLKQLNPEIGHALANLAALSRSANAELGSKPGYATGQLSVAALQDEPPDRRREWVRSWLAHVRGNARCLTREHVEAILNVLGKGRPNRCVQIPGGTIWREYDCLRYEPASSKHQMMAARRLRLGQSVSLAEWRIHAGLIEQARGHVLPIDVWGAVVDAEAAAETLLVRNPITGDRVRPCGMKGHRKLAEVLVDRKVPRSLRRHCAVVQLGAEVLWVPGVIRSSLGLVGPETEEVIWLRAESRVRSLLE